MSLISSGKKFYISTIYQDEIPKPKHIAIKNVFGKMRQYQYFKFEKKLVAELFTDVVKRYAHIENRAMFVRSIHLDTDSGTVVLYDYNERLTEEEFKNIFGFSPLWWFNLYKFIPIDVWVVNIEFILV